MKSALAIAAGLAAGLGLIPVQSWAVGTANRVWVSGRGVDQAGCGAPTAPCRSLQYSHDNRVAAGGEIDILDPAGYGAVTITKAISIVNDGVGTAGVQTTTGNAITINAGPTDAVYLRGLNVDGANFTGLNGIAFNSGASLTLADCVVRHFSQFGIDFSPSSNGTSAALISDTVSSDNISTGLSVDTGSGTAVLFVHAVRLTTDNNNQGVSISGGAGGSVDVVMAGAVVARNASTGFSVDALTNNVIVALDGALVSQNQSNGLEVTGGAVVHLTRSAFLENTGYGLNNSTSPPGAVFSTGDNRFQGNSIAPRFGPSPSSELLQ